jgi:hypothetical protein
VVGRAHRPRWLRLLILKHVRNWSYHALEREVRANLVYRDFTRVGGGKTPDAKTMGRWGLAVDPDTIRQIHDRIVQIAQQQGVTQGRRMRVDTTVVETNIHHPTDSTLLGGWGASADPHHEEDHRDHGRCRNEVARPEPKRKAAAARYLADCARQGAAQSRKAQERLRAAVELDEPCGGVRPASPTSSARWSSCRKPKTKS